MRRAIGFPAVVAMLSVLWGACSGGDGDAEELKALYANPRAFAFAVDDRFSVGAIGEDAEGRRFEVKATWTSSDPAVVEVDDEGTALGLAPGEAVLTARHGGFDARIDVRVIPSVTKLRIVPEEVVLWPGDEVALQLIATGDSGVRRSARPEWSSSDTSVVEVGAEGLLVGRAVGEVEIAAEAQGARATARVQVDPLPADHVEITAPKTTLEIGESVQLTAIVRNRDGGEVEGQTVRWESLSSIVVSVDGAGRARILRPGVGEVRAYTDDAEGTILLDGRIRYRQLVKLTNSGGTEPTFCGLDPEGIAYCHGDNFFGQLGDGTTRASSIPGRVVGAPPFVQISVPRAQEKGTISPRTFDGITADGKIFRWGEDAPPGNWVSRDHAVVERIDRPWKDIRRGGPAGSISEGREFCELTSLGAALCHFGQAVREGPSLPTSADPAPEYAPIVQIAAARPFCWRYETGEVSCWSKTEEEDEYSPNLVGMGVPIVLPEPAVDLAAAGHSACALGESGALYCWQFVYELIPETLIHEYWRFEGISSAQPAQVPAPITRLYSDYDRVCGSSADGVYCWDLAILTNGNLDDFRWLGSPYELELGGIEVEDLDLHSKLVRDVEGRYWQLGEEIELVPRQPW